MSNSSKSFLNPKWGFLGFDSIIYIYCCIPTEVQHSIG